MEFEGSSILLPRTTRKEDGDVELCVVVGDPTLASQVFAAVHLHMSSLG